MDNNQELDQLLSTVIACIAEDNVGKLHQFLLAGYPINHVFKFIYNPNDYSQAVREKVATSHPNIEHKPYENWTLSHLAAFFGSEQCLKVLVSRGANIAQISTYKINALHMACRNRYISLNTIEAILTNCRETSAVNQSDNAGHRPLNWILESQRTDIKHTVELLLEAGAEINYHDCPEVTDATPLFYAIALGNVELCELLLNYNADPNALCHDSDFNTARQQRIENNQPHNQHTALHYAIIHNKLDMIRLLLKRGADPFVQDSNARNALELAIDHENVEAVDLLTIFMFEPPRYSEAKQYQFLGLGDSYTSAYSPLRRACEIGNLAIVKLLVARGAGYNLTYYTAGSDKQSDNLVGHVNQQQLAGYIDAAGGNESEIGKYLHEYFNNYLNSADARLLISAIQGDTHEMQMALQAGADLHARARFGLFYEKYPSDKNHLLIDAGPSALHIAFVYRQEQYIHCLIDSGFYIDYRNYSSSATLLHWVAGDFSQSQDDHFLESIFDFVLLRGADINALDHTGTSPLCYSAYYGVPKTAKLLLVNGADFRLRIGFNPKTLTGGNASEIAHYQYQQRRLGRLLDVARIIDEFTQSSAAELLYENILQSIYDGNTIKSPVDLSDIDLTVSQLVELFMAIISYNRPICLRLSNVSSISVLKYIIENRPDSFERTVQIIENVNVVDTEQCNVLHWILDSTALTIDKKCELVAVVLQSNVDIDQQEKITRDSVLHKAAKLGDEELCMQLINHGANLEAVNNNGNKPYEISGLSSRLKFILSPDYHLFNSLASIELKDFENKFADKTGHAHQVDDVGNSFLHKAVEYRRLDIVKYLLSQNVPINQLNHRGETPLHIAVKNGDIATVNELIRHGARSNIYRKLDNKSVWHLAHEGSHREITEILARALNDNEPTGMNSFREPVIGQWLSTPVQTKAGELEGKLFERDLLLYTQAKLHPKQKAGQVFDQHFNTTTELKHVVDSLLLASMSEFYDQHPGLTDTTEAHLDSSIFKEFMLICQGKQTTVPSASQSNARVTDELVAKQLISMIEAEPRLVSAVSYLTRIEQKSAAKEQYEYYFIEHPKTNIVHLLCQYANPAVISIVLDYLQKNSRTFAYLYGCFDSETIEKFDLVSNLLQQRDDHDETPIEYTLYKHNDVSRLLALEPFITTELIEDIKHAQADSSQMQAEDDKSKKEIDKQKNDKPKEQDDDSVDSVTAKQMMLHEKLYQVVRSGSVKLTEYLLTLGASPIISEPDTGNTQLHIAARLGYMGIVSLLLERHLFTVDVPNAFGQSALLVAAAHGQLAVLKQLIEDYAANTSQLDSHGEGLIHSIARGGYAEMLEYIAPSVSEINQQSALEITPLTAAVEGYYAANEDTRAVQRYTACLNVLLSRGARIDYPPKAQTALHMATQLQLSAVLKLFLRQQTYNVDVANEQGSTALHLAARIGHQALSDMLIAANASITRQDFTGQTPVQVASNEELSQQMQQQARRRDYEAKPEVQAARLAGQVQAAQHSRQTIEHATRVTRQLLDRSEQGTQRTNSPHSLESCNQLGRVLQMLGGAGIVPDASLGELQATLIQYRAIFHQVSDGNVTSNESGQTSDLLCYQQPEKKLHS